MADASRSAPPSFTGVPVKQGPAGKSVSFVLNFVFWIVLGFVGNILFEWVCMGFIWPDQGPRRSQQMLEEELRYLNDDFAESLIVDRPAAFAADLADQMRTQAFVRTGIAAWIKKAPPPLPAEQSNHFKRLLHDGALHLRDYVQAAMLASQVYAVRVAVLVLAMPVFALAGLVGLVDGMVRRDLRRFCAGREHGQVFHLAKRAIAPALQAPWIIYLAWPTTVHPNLVILPFAALFALAMAVSSATFKKYL